MRKVLLWVLVVVGLLITLIGLLALVSTATDSTSTAHSDELVGSVMFLVVGLGIGAPSIFGLRRKSPLQPLPEWLGATSGGVPPTSATLIGNVAVPGATT